MHRQRDAKARREMVGKYFPRLAYLLSNAIIFMGQDELLANARWVDRAKQFAFQAIGDTQQNLHLPVLILIQNKYPGRRRLSREELTAQFFDKHSDARDLRKFFSDVHCITLPFYDEQSSANEIEYFNAQTDDLRQLLIRLCEQHKDHLLPHFAWVQVTRKIIKKLSKDSKLIDMYMILKDVLIDEKSKNEDRVLSFLFRRLYEQRLIHSTRWFHDCREFSMEVLAYFIVRRLSKRNVQGFEELIKKECKDNLEQLWKLLEEYRPCEALYMGRGYVAERDRPVFCYKYKSAHGSMYQTSESVREASWWRALVEIFTDRSTIDKWEGQFQSNDRTADKPGDDMQNKFLQMAKDYREKANKDPEFIYQKFNCFLKKCQIEIKSERFYSIDACFCCLGPLTEDNEEGNSYLCSICCQNCCEQLQKCPGISFDEGVERQSTTNDSNKCFICMSSPREVTFDPCSHCYLCQSCADKILNQFKKCPVCKVGATGVKRIYG